MANAKTQTPFSVRKSENGLRHRRASARVRRFERLRRVAGTLPDI
jgi:hypothetical protein